MPSARFKRFLVPLALIAASVFVALLIALGADAVAGNLVEDPRLTAGLLFPPQMELAFKTYEFDVTARTNSLGLRDDEYDVHKRPRVLVAAVGDSYTFGQGVEIEDTWVQRVERILIDKGLSVEILNFGEPGASPRSYASVAEESLSILKPDLVLVAVLQTDDLQQSDPAKYDEHSTHRRDPLLRTALRRWFPNLTDLAYRERAKQVADREKRSRGRWRLITHRWKSDFEKSYATFHPEIMERFLRLPPAMQQAFHDGELNPILITNLSDYIRQNAEAEHTLPVESAKSQAHIETAARYLERIRRAADRWGGRVLVLSVPSMIDNDPFGMQVWHEVLYSTYDLRRDDLRADEAIRQAADLAGLPFENVTEAFREVSWKEPLFYPIDTHMTARGNEVFAELIAPIVEREVRDIAD